VSAAVPGKLTTLALYVCVSECADVALHLCAVLLHWRHAGVDERHVRRHARECDRSLHTDHAVVCACVRWAPVSTCLVWITQATARLCAVR
jgi:hypothetical protein